MIRSCDLVKGRASAEKRQKRDSARNADERAAANPRKLANGAAACTIKGMITELTVSNFRHIERLAVSPLGRITLIGGGNGAGKTALLEALWLLGTPNSPGLAMSLDAFRGAPDGANSQTVPGVFRDFDARKPIRISAKSSSGSHRAVKIAVEDNPVTVRLAQSGELEVAEGADGFQVVSVFKDEKGEKYFSQAWRTFHPLGSASPNSEPKAAARISEKKARIPNRFPVGFMSARRRDTLETLSANLGKLQLAGKEKRAVDFLRNLEPSLSALTVIATGGAPIVHAYIGDNLPIPANLVGEGFSRMLELAVGVAQVEGGLLLVDEIENGLHYSAHKGIFTTLLELAVEFDVQVVATTHSRECVIAAREALGSKGADDFAYHRIARRDGKVRAFSFDSEMIDVAADFKMEIR